MPATYPAVTFEQAVDLVEQDVNIFHDILNGDSSTSVPVDVGSVPSVRKALTDMAAYKVPQPWQNGVMEIDFLQPRIYSNGFYIPVTVPITMGVAPDSNWKLFSYVGSQYTDPGWSSNWDVNLLGDEMAVARAPSTTFGEYTHSMFVCNNCYFDGSDWRQITGTGGGYLEIGENQFNGGEADIMLFGSGAAGGVVTFTQWEASELNPGPIEIATQVEVDAATDDEKAVTPLKLKESVAPAVTGFTASTAYYTMDDGLGGLISMDTVGGQLPPGNSWTTIGPTGSGADRIWDTLDGIPSGAKYIRVYAILEVGETDVTGSGQVKDASGFLYIRPDGSTDGIANDTRKLVARHYYIDSAPPVDTIGGTGTATMDVLVEGSANNVFEFNHTGDGSALTFYLVGFGM